MPEQLGFDTSEMLVAPGHDGVIRMVGTGTAVRGAERSAGRSQ